MPQMHPLMWAILFIMTFSSLMFMMSLLFFSSPPKPSLTSSAPKSPLFNWKW